MKIITENDLAVLLATIKTETAISLVSTTTPKLNKKHRSSKEENPFLKSKVLHTAFREGFLAAKQEKPVSEAVGLWGGAGELVSPALCQHKVSKRKYVVFYPSLAPVVDTWTIDGIKLAKSELTPYLPIDSSTEEVAATSIKIISFSAVMQLSFASETYIVAH